MSEKDPEDWGTLSFYLPQLRNGTISDVPLNTEASKPSRYGEMYEQHTPLEANK